MEITGIVSLKLSLFLLKMKRTIQLLGDSHSSILLPYALSLSSPKHNSSITFQIPPCMALYIFSFLEHSLTFFQRFPTYFPTFWQCMTSLYIMFPPSGNAWLCPRWIRSYKTVSGVPPGNETRFQISGNAWHLVPDLWQCYIRFQLSLAIVASLSITFLVSGNVS